MIGMKSTLRLISTDTIVTKIYVYMLRAKLIFEQNWLCPGKTDYARLVGQNWLCPGKIQKKFPFNLTLKKLVLLLFRTISLMIKGQMRELILGWPPSPRLTLLPTWTIPIIFCISQFPPYTRYTHDILKILSANPYLEGGWRNFRKISKGLKNALT